MVSPQSISTRDLVGDGLADWRPTLGETARWENLYRLVRCTD
jgi:hypothetical protein